ncbi:helix-turn-helix domain-containing protein [Paenibacillus sp. LMG 31458]|uniref:Helix-turn-helix domain-containing protein n=1 Tax=Paenibacillus phytorum TaxID=2654977 RepID=A0ABX1XW53_9BACL|nr:helix-turn-helix domain-containing protein [Paenibacillus phytorum]NOU72504.1 helix-turn-helix domain-containing protein [Paenibacillus phytorum]
MSLGKKQRAPQVSRLITYFFSYLFLVVFLLAAIGGFVYTKFFDTLTGIVEQSNITSLKQIRDQIDQRFNELRQMSLQISSNHKLMRYTFSEGGYEAKQGIQELKSYGSTHSYLLDIGLYFNGMEDSKVYAASGVYDLDTFFDKVYPFENLNHDQFEKLAAGLKEPYLLPVQSINLNGANKLDAAIYMFPLPGNGVKPTQVILYMISGAEMKRAIGGGIKEFEGEAFIIDKQDRIIVSASSGRDEGKDAARLLQWLPADRTASIVSSLNLPEGPHSSVQLASGFMPWSYYVVVPTGQFLTVVRQTQTIFYVIVASVLLLGIGLSLFLARHHYKPIKKLMDSVRKNHASEEHRQNNELDWLSEAFEHMNLENNDLRSHLKTKSAALKEKVMADLIKGNVRSQDELDELLGKAGMQLAYERFAVLLIRIDDYRNFEKTNTPIIQNVLKYSIMNVAEEISMEVGHGYGIDLTENRGIALLAGIKAQEETSCEEMLHEAAGKIRDFFERLFPFTVTIGISELFHHVLDTPVYYKQAVETSHRRFLEGENVVLHYQDAALEASSPYKFLDEAVSKLVKAIKLGDRELAGAVIAEEINEIRNSFLTPGAARGICQGMSIAVFKLAKEISRKEQDPYLDETLQAFAFETMEEFERIFIRYCMRFADEMSSKKESRNFELRDKIVDYVSLHYADVTLNSNKLADIFDVSPSYLSRFFKNQTGTTLSEYVEETRMNQAKEMLQAKSMSVKEIVERVGYTDQSHFIRKFKKREGVTPQQYKMLFPNARE